MAFNGTPHAGNPPIHQQPQEDMSLFVNSTQDYHGWRCNRCKQKNQACDVGHVIQGQPCSNCSSAQVICDVPSFPEEKMETLRKGKLAKLDNNCLRCDGPNNASTTYCESCQEHVCRFCNRGHYTEAGNCTNCRHPRGTQNVRRKVRSLEKKSTKTARELEEERHQHRLTGMRSMVQESVIHRELQAARDEIQQLSRISEDRHRLHDNNRNDSTEVNMLKQENENLKQQLASMHRRFNDLHNSIGPMSQQFFNQGAQDMAQKISAQMNHAFATGPVDNSEACEYSE